MSTPRPDLATIDDYATGHMADDDAAAFEEALFDGAAADELRFVDQVARTAGFLLPRGTYYVGVTRAELDAVSAAGHRVQVHDFGRARGHDVDVVVDLDCDVFVSRFDLGVHDLARVDVEIEIPPHGVIKVIRDVRVDQAEGAIYGACERDLAALAYAAPRTIARVIGQRDGHRVVVAEYAVTHGL